VGSIYGFVPYAVALAQEPGLKDHMNLEERGMKGNAGEGGRISFTATVSGEFRDLGRGASFKERKT